MNVYLRLKNRVWLAIILLTILFGLLPVLTTLAHTRVEVGPYAIVVGWLVEPPVIGERNAVTIEVTKDEQPVLGVESSLDLEFLYAGREFRANINPTETAGTYTAEIFPTVRGQYSVRLFGEIDGVEIDEIVDPEEVFAASRIQFPEAEPDLREMQQQIETLNSELSSARLFSFIGIGIGAVGVIMGIISSLRRKR